MKGSGVRIMLVATVAGLSLAACRAKETPSSQDSAGTAKAASDSAKSSGMSGMAGMRGMVSPGMMDSMQMQMRSMAAMNPDQMASMLPMHRQMVANMLSQMMTEMRSMNMAPDAAWTALSDSVRQDLIGLPEMAKSELKQGIPAHHARVMRLMQMHRDMMAKMGK